jgi:type I restriction enzyme, S subunit
MSAECTSENIPPGYKQTEVGVIPEDWEIIKLSQISAFITKGSTPTTYGFKWEDSGVLFLRSECVSECGLDLIQSMFISEAANSLLRRSEVSAGDILITITGNVGRVVLLSGIDRANINQHIARVRIISSNIVPSYVFHFLSQSSSRNRFNAITTGQAYPQISLKQVREAEISIPPTKAEQEAIAEALSDTDALIESLEQLIAKKRQIKQGAMQELLTGKKRLQGFGEGKRYKQTELGVIPEDWEVVQLKDLISIRSGFAFSSTHFSEKGPILLTLGNFKLEGGLYFNERNTKHYSGSFNSSMVFNYGDLLIVMTDLTPECNLLGKPAFIHLNEPILHNQRIGKIITINTHISLTFLYSFFLSKAHAVRMKETATGSTVRHTSTKTIYSSSIAIPPTMKNKKLLQPFLTIWTLIKLFRKKSLPKPASSSRV